MELGTGDIVSLLRKYTEAMKKPVQRYCQFLGFRRNLPIFSTMTFNINSLSLEEIINSRLKDMLELFDDETSNGKLYINYPMIESIRYAKELPDRNYYQYTVKCAECHDFKRLSLQI